MQFAPLSFPALMYSDTTASFGLLFGCQAVPDVPK